MSEKEGRSAAGIGTDNLESEVVHKASFPVRAKSCVFSAGFGMVWRSIG